MQVAPMVIAGRCHCGNISFELRWLPEPTEIIGRGCTCTFCTKHGGVWTSCRDGELTVSIRNPELRSRYTFGTKTAEFHVCSQCGIVPVVTSRIDGATYAVVNVNAFEGVDGSLITRGPVGFDSEDEKVRLARRKRNWIGRVTFREGDA